MDIVISSYQDKILFFEPVMGFITTETTNSRLLQHHPFSDHKKLHLGGVYSYKPSLVPLWILKPQVSSAVNSKCQTGLTHSR